MKKEKAKKILKKTWHFIWHDESLLSWIVNVLLAFLIIYFIVYPVLGLVFSTSHPIVAVVSPSMEHQDKFDDWWFIKRKFEKGKLCGNKFHAGYFFR